MLVTYNIEREMKLIKENMGLVRSIAQKFKPSSELQEYAQAGSIGLLKAIRSYDENKSDFPGWAYHHIRWEIIKYIKSIRPKGLVPLSTVEEPSYLPNTSLFDVIPDYLTNEEQQIIVLRVANYNLKEISEIMGMSTYSLGKTLKTAVDKIREANS